MGFPGGPVSKASVCLQCRRPGFDPWIGKIPWSRKWQPTPVFLPGESHRQKSLVDYSPRSHTESDTTEQQHTFEYETSKAKNNANGGFPGGPVVQNLCSNAGDMDLITVLGISPGEGNGSPLQCSCLENPIDRGSWRATFHGVTNSWTQLSN